MHIAFAGGGTAGHVTPALSIANAIHLNDPRAQITFFTSPAGIEKKILQKYRYRTIEIPIHNLSRSLSWKTIRTAIEIPLATSKAMRVLKQEQIDMVIGTGGYVSFPVVSAAQKLHLPNFLHESNSIPGLVTKLLSKRANGVLLNFPSCKAHLPSAAKTHQVGNFILTEEAIKPSFALKEELGVKQGEKLVLVTGGSLGAMSMNELILNMVRQYGNRCEKMHFLISTGSQNYSACRDFLGNLFDSLPRNIHLFPYISPMCEYLRAADIAITRAGACTLSELCHYRVPCIVIPYPKAAKEHQKHNAKAFADAGCCIFLEECDISIDTLLTTLESFLASTVKADTMRHCQSKFFKVNRFQELFHIFFNEN